MQIKILLIEDDPQQSKSIKTAIERKFPTYSVDILETESDFRKRVKTLSQSDSPPRIVISDVMLPWAFSAPDAPEVPKDVLKGTFRRAGIRCWGQFRKRKFLQEIPWIYFTVLDEKTIEFDKFSDTRTGYAQKASSIAPLLEEIEEFLDEQSPENEEREKQMLRQLPTVKDAILKGLKTPLSSCSPLLT